MKTPMTEYIEWLDFTIKVLPDLSVGAKSQMIIAKKKAESMLEKEKEFFEVALRWGDADLDDFVTKPYEYYKAIYNIKEK